ncbi:Type II inositol 1,4,5-trisphosphate 5-phosphatase FRA3 [Tetrabaena socialis]|uniref:Type II inositol 1,4,5-trisphosphate 5-phosphatase FRA3 n=1 Tax=Tetrabaena socialis TaxID=47790 RepID=A0A2J8AJN1_9CHLO|nr:Type II inositol 1,4,5-trisphosphate 5-phosphatase FRA3 [Tetrabaena socialis]|eukprot:PNH12727.1 Type II inositol 1,4,5-trisphosphate 5-phosphatase FRA3 [Tetrabaena socialis]
MSEGRPSGGAPSGPLWYGRKARATADSSGLASTAERADPKRRLMFVNSHFAAHQERVEERNEHYSKIVRQLHFRNTSKAASKQRQQQQADAWGRPGAGCYPGGGADADLDPADLGGPDAPAAEPEDHGPGMTDAALLVWAGDFNYRINASYADVRAGACAGRLAELFQLDQCRAEMEKGAVFRGLREPLVAEHPVFVPTYKFDKGVPASEQLVPAAEGAGSGRSRLNLPYDTSEKQRVPAWTDRVFYRGSRPGSHDVAAEEVSVSVSAAEDYTCVLEVNDSDHKPVYALLQVQLPAYKQDQKRRFCLAAAAAVHASAAPPPPPGSAPAVVASAISLQVRPNGSPSHVDLRSTGTASFIVEVVVERSAAGGSSYAPGAAAPLPSWLEVTPTRFQLPAPPGCGGHGAMRVQMRALRGDGGSRPPDAVRLRFILRPMYGMATLGSSVGPSVTVSMA